VVRRAVAVSVAGAGEVESLDTVDGAALVDGGIEEEAVITAVCLGAVVSVETESGADQSVEGIELGDNTAIEVSGRGLSETAVVLVEVGAIDNVGTLTVAVIQHIIASAWALRIQPGHFAVGSAAASVEGGLVGKVTAAGTDSGIDAHTENGLIRSIGITIIDGVVATAALCASEAGDLHGR
jgi:hypothetical protein